MIHLFVRLEALLQKHGRTLSILGHLLFGAFLGYAAMYLFLQKEWIYAGVACLPAIGALVSILRTKEEAKLWESPDDFMVLAFLLGLLSSSILLRLT